LQDRVLEVGALLYTTGLKRVVMAEDMLVDNEMPIPAEASEINHIVRKATDKFGLTSPDALSRLQNYFDMADTIAGKNIIDFDIPFYENWCLREKQDVIKKPMIDIETDLPGTKRNKLGYMAADDGFLNPFPHAALPDAWTTLKLIENKIEKVGLDAITARAASPRVTVQAIVKFETNHQAKKRGYAWSSDRRVWYKIIKEMDLESESKEAPFDIQKIEPIPTH
jgi:DNA polymerase III epsilon subunit-like protein